MTQLKCNNCGWRGTDKELVEVPEDGRYGDGYGFKGCPVCKTDWALMDIEGVVIDI